MRLARRTDPISSHIAAMNAQEFIERHERLILTALRRTQTGMTRHEIAQCSALTATQVGRRLAALEWAGRIERRLQDGKIIRRGRCAVWWAV